MILSLNKIEQKKLWPLLFIITTSGLFKKSTKFPDVDIQKSNILVAGPTGTGKTLIAQTLATITRCAIYYC